MRKTLEVAGFAFALVVAGCAPDVAKPATPGATGRGLDGPPVAAVVEKANFTLYVSNQSFEKPTMPITVTVDGRQVVSTDFHVGNQHQFIRFALEVPAGPRRVVARAGDGTVVDATFTMPAAGVRWGVLSFWASAAYYAPHLEWQYLEEEPHFA